MARDNRIDSLKGLLIILVILGHVITSLNNVNVVNHAVMGLIYVFHMPLFILISGYLTKSPGRQSSGEMWRGVANILITLVIFQLLYSIWVIFYGIDFMVALKLFPQGVLWYLLSLAYWKILLHYTPAPLLNRPALYLAIALAVSVLSGLTRLGNFMSLQRTMNFYVFFLLGYYYRQGMLNRRWWSNNVLHGGIVLVALPLILWLFPRCGNVMNGADHYPLSGIPEKMLILTCSIAMSLLVFNLVKDNSLLRRIGKDSMFYFLFHTLLVDGILRYGKINYGLPTTLPFILLYTALVVAALMALSRVKFLKWFTGPMIKRRPSPADQDVQERQGR